MDAEKVEDGIAFVAQRRKAATASGFAARLFSGVRDFFRALGNALKGNGFKTPESIFRDIREGGFGKRLSAWEGAAQPKFARIPEEESGAVSKAEFDKLSRQDQGDVSRAHADALLAGLV